MGGLQYGTRPGNLKGKVHAWVRALIFFPSSMLMKISARATLVKAFAYTQRRNRRRRRRRPIRITRTPTRTVLTFRTPHRRATRSLHLAQSGHPCRQTTCPLSSSHHLAARPLHMVLHRTALIILASTRRRRRRRRLHSIIRTRRRLHRILPAFHHPRPVLLLHAQTGASTAPARSVPSNLSRRPGASRVDSAGASRTARRTCSTSSTTGRRIPGARHPDIAGPSHPVLYLVPVRGAPLPSFNSTLRSWGRAVLPNPPTLNLTPSLTLLWTRPPLPPPTSPALRLLAS